jgi:hypothetical protein
MSKGQNEKSETYYFVTLETKGRKDWFVDDGFRTRVERRWVEVMRGQAESDSYRINAEEYAVNDHALHALIVITIGEGMDEMELLHRATNAFMDLTRKDWEADFRQEGELGQEDIWADSHKFRCIEKDTELRSLRDFIVQKMLGGEEINDLDDLEFEF